VAFTPRSRWNEGRPRKWWRRHESETTSRESYISREAITGADQRRVLTVLAGGEVRCLAER
jgi:hypothetical protein